MYETSLLLSFHFPLLASLPSLLSVARQRLHSAGPSDSISYTFCFFHFPSVQGIDSPMLGLWTLYPIASVFCFTLFSSFRFYDADM